MSSITSKKKFYPPEEPISNVVYLDQDLEDEEA
jgi:hypothetical protein